MSGKASSIWPIWTVILLIVLILFSNKELFAEPWYENYTKGKAALKKGNYESAIEFLEAAIRDRKEPKKNARTTGVYTIDYYPYYYLGMALSQLNRIGEAISSFESELNFGAILGTAEYEDLTNRLSNCQEMLGIASQEKPSTIESSIKERNDIVGDKMKFKSNSVSDPASPPLHNWRDKYLLGLAALEKGNNSESLSYLTESIELKSISDSVNVIPSPNGETYFPYYYRGLAYYNLKDKASAQGQFEIEISVGQIISDSLYSDLKEKLSECSSVFPPQKQMLPKKNIETSIYPVQWPGKRTTYLKFLSQMNSAMNPNNFSLKVPISAESY